MFGRNQHNIVEQLFNCKDKISFLYCKTSFPFAEFKGVEAFIGSDLFWIKSYMFLVWAMFRKAGTWNSDQVVIGTNTYL